MDKKCINLMKPMGDEMVVTMNVAKYYSGSYTGRGYKEGSLGTLDKVPYWLVDEKPVYLKEIYDFVGIKYYKPSFLLVTTSSTDGTIVSSTETVTIKSKNASNGTFGYLCTFTLGLSAQVKTVEGTTRWFDNDENPYILKFSPPTQTDSYKLGKRRFLCGGGVNA